VYILVKVHCHALEENFWIIPSAKFTIAMYKNIILISITGQAPYIYTARDIQNEVQKKQEIRLCKKEAVALPRPNSHVLGQSDISCLATISVII
jgi:hypothetical protein